MGFSQKSLTGETPEVFAEEPELRRLVFEARGVMVRRMAELCKTGSPADAKVAAETVTVLSNALGIG